MVPVQKWKRIVWGSYAVQKMVQKEAEKRTRSVPHAQELCGACGVSKDGDIALGIGRLRIHMADV
jgi:hypothetical protein